MKIDCYYICGKVVCYFTSTILELKKMNIRVEDKVEFD